MIKPTVGRVVLFHPAINSVEPGFAVYGRGPLAAIVAHVWSDDCLNLTVFDSNGAAHSRTSVPLIQDDALVPYQGYYCEWMTIPEGSGS